ncbi:MAG: hypothetical protein OXR05_17865 [Gemmatimonadota bacterium]|nr:hypothetical protein [Gemmatimonadota bacterium]
MRDAAYGWTWRDAAYEKGDTQSLDNEFFEVFDVRRRSEEHVAKLDKRSRFIDLFWPGVLIVEQKSAGRDLGKAYGQAGEYFDALPERGRPRYILANDFQTFELQDLDERETVSFYLPRLAVHREEFRFILGVQCRTADLAEVCRPTAGHRDAPPLLPRQAYPLSYRPCAQSKPYSMT